MPKSRKMQSCPVKGTLGVIDGRWKVLVLPYFFEGIEASAGGR